MVKTSHVTFSNQSDTLKCVDLLMTSSHLEPISDIDFRLVKLPTYPKSITIECSKSSGMYVNQSELCQSRVVTQLSNFYRRLPPDSLLECGRIKPMSSNRWPKALHTNQHVYKFMFLSRFCHTHNQ